MDRPVDPQIAQIEKCISFIKNPTAATAPEAKKFVEDSTVPDFVGIPGDPEIKNEDTAAEQIIKTGKAICRMKMTNGVFGNISARVGDRIIVTETGSSLAELENSIVVCDLGGKPLNGRKPSCEISSHVRIYRETKSNCVVHCHPFFMIANSLLYDKPEIFGFPVIKAEIGDGPNGISSFILPAILEKNMAIVYGHGVFTMGNDNFSEQLKAIYDLEYTLCRDKFISEISRLLKI